MRLARLDLTRYGKFTDRSIDFGERSKGRPDLHLVYGPNEAGKSTAFAAYLDLLFGIETRSRYNFIHPYTAMQIGGLIDLADDRQDLVRTKRNQASLLDRQGRPVAEALLQGELGGIDRAAYRTMFSLDDETLEAGGNSILASKGDLGELLFQGSSGLADLSRTLATLREEADGFHRPRKHGTTLSTLKAEIEALKQERDDVDTYASAYGQLVSARDQAGELYAAALSERGRIRTRIDEIGRLLDALPRLATLRTLRADLHPLANLPEAPAAWADMLPVVQRRETELATELKVVDEGLAMLSAELDAVVPDAAALAAAPRVERLEGPRARHLTADADLPERRLSDRIAAREIEALLRRLAPPPGMTPADVMLGASLTGSLRALMERRSGVITRRQAAEEEHEEALRAFAAAQARLDQAGQGNDATGSASMLAEALAGVRGSDHAARLTLAERASRRAQDALDERFAALRPWAGGIAELAALDLPEAAAFDRLLAERAKAETALERARDELDSLTDERLRLVAEVDALGRVAGVVTEPEASAIRAARDRAWAEHRTALAAETAAAFEDRMRRDDIVTSARFGKAADVAALRQASVALAKTEVDAARASERHDRALLRHGEVTREIAGTLDRLVPPLPGGAAADLGAFMLRRRDALAALATLRQAARDRDEAEADGRAARGRVVAALAAAGAPHDPAAALDRLMAAAQAVIDGESERRGLRDQVEVRGREVEARERALSKALAAESGWMQAWSETCGACWLGAGTMPSVEAAGEAMKALADLAPLLQKRADLDHRITAMEDDQAGFAAEVTALAATLGIPTEGSFVLNIDDAIQRAVAAARQAQAALDAGGRRLAAMRERRAALAADVAANARQKAEMTAFFAVETLDEVRRKLDDGARRVALDRQLRAAERDLRDALRQPDLARAEAVLESADRTALEGERAELEPRFAVEDERVREFYAQRGKARDAVEAVGGDDRVARIEERRRTLLLDIEDRARRYLRLRAGVAAAERGLRSYRDRHRSAMMAGASKAFRTVSRDAYSGLATQPDGQAEILMGVAADGSTKIASDLSKGTRFQLYLALRVAGYHEFAKLRRVVPFVADDIMETFDDFRAEEAFRLFAGMAEVGQVIYLTHHRHLIDIARAVCPTVAVHRLDAA